MQKVHKNKLNGYNKSIGKNLRYYRKMKDITQGTISELLGIDKSTVSLYENSKVNIPAKHIYAISEFLGTNVNMFFEPYEKKFK